MGRQIPDHGTAGIHESKIVRLVDNLKSSLVSVNDAFLFEILSQLPVAVFQSCDVELQFYESRELADGRVYGR